MGQACGCASGDDRKLDSARLKQENAVLFQKDDAMMAEQTRKSTELTDSGGMQIDLDAAMKEIIDDGTEEVAPTSARGHTSEQEQPTATSNGDEGAEVAEQSDPQQE